MTGIKRYLLTEKGAKFFEEHAIFENKLKKKTESMGPLFLFWMGLHADQMQRLQEPLKRLFAILFDLRLVLKENLTEQTLKEVEAFLNDTSEKFKHLRKRIERRKQI